MSSGTSDKKVDDASRVSAWLNDVLLLALGGFNAFCSRWATRFLCDGMGHQPEHSATRHNRTGHSYPFPIEISCSVYIRQNLEPSQ